MGIGIGIGIVATATDASGEAASGERAWPRRQGRPNPKQTGSEPRYARLFAVGPVGAPPPAARGERARGRQETETGRGNGEGGGERGNWGTTTDVFARQQKKMKKTTKKLKQAAARGASAEGGPAHAAGHSVGPWPHGTPLKILWAWRTICMAVARELHAQACGNCLCWRHVGVPAGAGRAPVLADV